MARHEPVLVPVDDALPRLQAFRFLLDVDQPNVQLVDAQLLHDIFKGAVIPFVPQFVVVAL